jgi:hypothetical protein
MPSAQPTCYRTPYLLLDQIIGRAYIAGNVSVQKTVTKPRQQVGRQAMFGADEVRSGFTVAVDQNVSAVPIRPHQDGVSVDLLL